MSSENFLKELQTIGEKLLLKLQKLPKSEPVEIVAFCVILLFIGEYVGGDWAPTFPKPPSCGRLKDGLF
uniref:Small integral membrane protein 5 n=1 Tax=Sphenodon punctatus TaxID=8508 RepID=A0A8D0GVV1_SPHPU